MNPQADVVKKSYLKYKTVKVKGSAGLTVHGPKGFKDFWFAFRCRNSGEKLFEYYPTERKFQELTVPKGLVHLNMASSVQAHNPEKPQQFCIEMQDSNVCFFEAASVYEAQEWVSCLNAVLFGRGPNGEDVLQYEADLQDATVLPYSGPCLLEIKDGELIVWTRDSYQEVARWKLAHIRSFKAKKNLFTVHAGSRSSTGQGEFFFRSSQSVQITHAIETIVQELKNRQHRTSQTLAAPRTIPNSTSAPSLSRLRNSHSEKRPLPALPLRNSPRTSPPTPPTDIQSPLPNVPNWIPEHFAPKDRKLSASAVANIPNYCPPVYEDLTPNTPPHSEPPAEGYGRLEHTHTRSPYNIMSPDSIPENYGHLNVGATNAPALKPRVRRTGDYEEVPDEPLAEHYDKVEHVSSRPALNRPFSVPVGQKSPNFPRKAPPPKPLPYKPKSEQPIPAQPPAARREEVYSEIDQDVPVNVISVAEGYNKLERGKTTAGVRTRSKSPTVEGYGRLDRRSSNSDPELTSGKPYGALQHFPHSKRPMKHPTSLYQPEEYGKLDHLHSTFDPYGSLSSSDSYREAPNPPEPSIFIDAKNLSVRGTIVVGAKRQEGRKPVLKREDSEQMTSEEFYAALRQSPEREASRQDLPEEEPYSKTAHSKLPRSKKAHSYVNVDDGKFSPQNGLPGSQAQELYSALDYHERPSKTDPFECLYDNPKEDQPPDPPKRGESMKDIPPQVPSDSTSPPAPTAPPQVPSHSPAPMKPKPKPKLKPKPEPR